MKPEHGSTSENLPEMHARVLDTTIQVRSMTRDVFVFHESTLTHLGGQQGFNRAKPRATVVRLLCGLGVLGNRESRVARAQRAMGQTPELHRPA